eukprot:TRINITY_DN61167_c0_g1_i1.p1 TRINITY_DN61167_c0_g1~~TRINITY_DN61167_c0_g1_i1.p1  ORF type:complete len:466 (+),score=123.40 TRINITY_DN61167_c0_g1_i1:63-1400(+)
MTVAPQAAAAEPAQGPPPAEQCSSCAGLECLAAEHWAALSHGAPAAAAGGAHSAPPPSPRAASAPVEAPPARPPQQAEQLPYALLHGALRRLSAPPPGRGGLSAAARDAALYDAGVRMILHGIPSAQRPELWPLLSGAAVWRRGFQAGLFDRLLTLAPDGDIARRVAKDVERSFPQSPGFGSGGVRSAALQRVLLAYAAFDPKVGYTQGMAYLAGLLLLEGLQDEDAFWVFVALTHGDPWGMRCIYAPELEPHGWRRRSEEVWVHARRRVPDLVEWAQANGTHADSLTLPFIPGLFANRMPIHLAARVLDAFLAVGWEAVHSLLATLLASAWDSAGPARRRKGGGDASELLPAMYRECAEGGEALLDAAWQPLLPSHRLRSSSSGSSTRRGAHCYHCCCCCGVSPSSSASSGGGPAVRHGDQPYLRYRDADPPARPREAVRPAGP